LQNGGAGARFTPKAMAWLGRSPERVTPSQWRPKQINSIQPNEKPGGSIPCEGISEHNGFNSRIFNVSIYNEIHPTSHHLIVADLFGPDRKGAA
jgi:hypothetical protein